MAPELLDPVFMEGGRCPGTTGYTMVELVLVLVVLGILTVVSVTRLQPALEHGKVNSAASVMAGDLQYAQLMAARQRKPAVVIVNTAVKSYVIRDRADASIIFRTRYFGADTEYSLDELTATGGSLEVFPTGVTRTTTTYTLGLHGYRREVKFTKAGQIRILRVP